MSNVVPHYVSYAPVGILTIAILTLAWSVWSFSKKYAKDKEIKDTDFFINMVFENNIKDVIYEPMIKVHRQLIGKKDNQEIEKCLKEIQLQITICNRYLSIFESINKNDTQTLELFLARYEDSIYKQYILIKDNANSFFRLEKYALYQLSIFQLLLCNMLANITKKDMRTMTEKLNKQNKA